MNVKPFVKYIVEREKIRQKKEAGEPRPWTKDDILNTYKFTNVHREHDRTTQQLRKLYDKHADKSPDDVTLLHCGIYRYFGTWEFAHDIGWTNKITKGFFRHLVMVAKTRLAAGERVFTGAYVITNAGLSEPKENVVTRYLDRLWFCADLITKCMGEAGSWEAGFRELTKLDGFGGTGFMAKEVLQDYLLCRPGKWCKDRDTWSPMGPGARRGINRLLGQPVDRRETEAYFIAALMDVRGAVNDELVGTGIRLTAHDVQFCLCEFDKYERVRLGQGRPRSKYKPAEEK